MLRILALVIALAATAVAQQDTASANADPPSASSKTADSRKIAAIEELLSLTKVDQTLQRILLQFEAAFSQQVEKLVPPLQDRELRSKILQDVQEFQTQIFGFARGRFRFENLRPAFVKIYDEMFSSEEIAGLVSFYRSPVGQAWVQKNPAIMEKATALSQQIMREADPEMEKLKDAWVEKMKQKYPDLGQH